MPCRSDYLAPTDRELQLRRAALLLVYVNEQLRLPSSADLCATAADAYAKRDFVPELCAALRGMTEAERDRIVYNGRNRTARILADWWEEHEAADEQRRAQGARTEEERRRMAERQQLRAQALDKLTPEECAALGLTKT